MNIEQALKSDQCWHCAHSTPVKSAEEMKDPNERRLKDFNKGIYNAPPAPKVICLKGRCNTVVSEHTKFFKPNTHLSPQHYCGIGSFEPHPSLLNNKTT